MKDSMIYAHLSCSELTQSINWFEKLFGHPPDSRPMDGLAEWNHGSDASLQVWLDAGNAGRGTLTLIVTGRLSQGCGKNMPV